MAGILEGVKVLDMGHVVAAPAAAAMMADWGADVIKVEPLAGEMIRGLRRFQDVDIVLQTAFYVMQKSSYINPKKEKNEQYRRH